MRKQTAHNCSSTPLKETCEIGNLLIDVAGKIDIGLIVGLKMFQYYTWEKRHHLLSEL